MTDKEKIRAYIEKLHREHRGSEGDSIFRKALRTVLFYIDSMQEEPKECMYSKDNYTDEDRKVLCDGCEEDCEYAPKVIEDMLNAKTAAESLGISQEEHDRIVDELIYGKGPKLVDADDLPKEKPASEIDFEQELYKAFGHVKDFTLCLKIARRFYEIGRNHQEPVSEDLEEASKEWLRPQLDKSYANYGETKMMELTHFDGYAMLDAIEFGANWQKEHMMAKAIDGHATFEFYGLDSKTYGTIAHDPICLDDLGLKDTDKVKVIVIKED